MKQKMKCRTCHSQFFSHSNTSLSDIMCLNCYIGTVSIPFFKEHSKSWSLDQELNWINKNYPKHNITKDKLLKIIIADSI